MTFENLLKERKTFQIGANNPIIERDCDSLSLEIVAEQIEECLKSFADHCERVKKSTVQIVSSSQVRDESDSLEDMRVARDAWKKLQENSCDWLRAKRIKT